MPRPETHSDDTGWAPRFGMLWAALVYAFATLTLAYPALSGKFLVNAHSDQYIAGFAFRDFATQAVRAGQGIPHWNPYLFGGMPYVAAMHGDMFYPTALLRVLVGTDTGMTWGFIIHLFLGGLFTYGFLRAWGLGFIESLVGGMAYMLSGPIASYASPGHDGKLFVSALLPLALWQLVRGMRDGRNWAWGAFAVTVGLAVLSPHPQLLQYLLLTSGAFTLFLAFTADMHGIKLDRRTAVRRLAFALGAVLVGMAIGAIQFAPLREYVPWSPRANGQGYEYSTSYSFPLIELVNLYLPQFTGILDKYWGPNRIHLHSEYIGGSVMLLASLAIGGATRRNFRRFWIGVAIVSFLWMLGGSTPFFYLIYNLVPGTKYFRAPSTIIYVFSLSLSVLAALGTERVLTRTCNKKIVIGWGIAGIVVALLASVGLFTAWTRIAAVPFAQAIAAQNGYPESAIPDVLDQVAKGNGPDVVMGAWRALLFIALSVGLTLAWLQRKISIRIFGIALVIVIGADLWSIGRLYWLFSSPASKLYGSDAVIEYLKKDPVPGRVAVLATSGAGVKYPDPYFGGDRMGTGTGLMVHGIRSITGYHGNQLGRYKDLADYELAPGAGPVLMSPMFWRHENVRYLYTNAALTDTSLKLAAGPVTNSAGSTVYLYKLPGDDPYAWLAAGAIKAPDSDAKPAVVDPRFDARRLAVYDSAATEIPPRPTGMPAPDTIKATTTQYAPGHALITLAAPAPEGSSLIVSENYFPGWTALVDGKSKPAYRADYNLIGVPLPAGAHTIELSFHDAAVDTGKSITFVACFVALLMLAGGVVADRRQSA